MTRINIEAFQRVRREIAQLKGKPSQPLADAQAAETTEKPAASQTELSRMYGRWLDDRAKTDQGGDS